ncbi:hypothetical protein FUAX_41000 (plasmid) [Fulvitalea axinellae]|uniref:4Fe-4S ferredoxin-type domain-containing protein n=1 Tax=Fulvitalea axinellae TaxID=1182444 RepID=A0AAU9CN21_9BACT|nr:hypothetical protein FUAX_41000 [Fulvitalea axinellae]
MAYFSNGAEGTCFEAQCSKCKFGQKSCPIAYVQNVYNYDAEEGETSRDILDHLVKNDGTCEMFRTFREDLEINTEQHAL